MHDDAIQSLLAASQDIKEAARGQLDSLDRAAEALDQAIAQLRDAVFELHPVTLEYGGLEQALKAIAKRQGRRGRYHTRVRVNSEAVGVHDMLVVAVGRELLTNIAKHATASEVLVDLARTDTSIVLQVSDDGRGMEPAQRQVALRHGHIGLVSIAERVAAVGGTLDIMSEVGHGTVVRVRLPSGPSWGPLRCRAKGGAVQLAPGSR
jgi:two-component system NarL family sensor kinase